MGALWRSTLDFRGVWWQIVLGWIFSGTGACAGPRSSRSQPHPAPFGHAAVSRSISLLGEHICRWGRGLWSRVARGQPWHLGHLQHRGVTNCIIPSPPGTASSTRTLQPWTTARGLGPKSPLAYFIPFSPATLMRWALLGSSPEVARGSPLNVAVVRLVLGTHCYRAKELSPTPSTSSRSCAEKKIKKNHKQSKGCI